MPMLQVAALEASVATAALHLAATVLPMAATALEPPASVAALPVEPAGTPVAMLELAEFRAVQQPVVQESVVQPFRVPQVMVAMPLAVMAPAERMKFQERC
jgi:hypothetical protein